MARRIGAKRRDRIVEDILHAQHDVVALAQERARRLLERVDELFYVDE